MLEFKSSQRFSNAWTRDIRELMSDFKAVSSYLVQPNNAIAIIANKEVLVFIILNMSKSEY